MEISSLRTSCSLLASPVRYKLGDFGSAINSYDEASIATIGSSVAEGGGYTFGYMSPEMIQILGGMNHKLTLLSDIWSFGVTLLKLTLAFDIRTRGDLKIDAKLRNGSWTFQNDVLDQLNDVQRDLWLQQSDFTKEVSTSCLHCNPNDRASAQFMKQSQSYLRLQNEMLSSKICDLQRELSVFKLEKDRMDQNFISSMKKESSQRDEINNFKAVIEQQKNK